MGTSLLNWRCCTWNQKGPDELAVKSVENKPVSGLSPLILEDPNWTERDYDGMIAYTETGRAQVALSELWAERLCGSDVLVSAIHPGRGKQRGGLAGCVPSRPSVDGAILFRPGGASHAPAPMHRGVERRPPCAVEAL